MEQYMELKYIRMAELVRDIEKLNAIIDLHQQTTQSLLMIRQYQFKHGEFLSELQDLLKPVRLFIGMTAV